MSAAATSSKNQLLIGLTGGIGCGKSTVATVFERLGVRLIDTDRISRQLTQSGGDAIPAIREAFGDGFIDVTGAMDRVKMRALIFSDNRAKEKLENILHPAISTQAKLAAESPSQAPYTLVVVPLLFETSVYRDWLQRILVIDCPEGIQIERTMQRSGLSEPDVRAIISQQITRARRLALADDVIRNDADLDTLSRQVEEIHLRYLSIAAGSN